MYTKEKRGNSFKQIKDNLINLKHSIREANIELGDNYNGMIIKAVKNVIPFD